jgi:hypothetical protein
MAHEQRAHQPADADREDVDASDDGVESRCRLGCDQADRGHREIAADQGEAIDAIVDVARRRPCDGEAKPHRNAHGRSFVQTQQQQDEHRKGRRRDEAEVTHATRDENRRPREEHTRQPGRGRISICQSPREAEHRVGGQDRQQEVDAVERGHHAERADERQRQDIRKRGVIVQTQIRAAGRGKDFVREVGNGAVLEQLVLKNPEVPHVDAGVSFRRTRQVCSEMTRQRPGERDGDNDIRKERNRMDAPGGTTRRPAVHQLIHSGLDFALISGGCHYP